MNNWRTCSATFGTSNDIIKYGPLWKNSVRTTADFDVDYILSYKYQTLIYLLNLDILTPLGSVSAVCKCLALSSLLCSVQYSPGMAKPFLIEFYWEYNIIYYISFDDRIAEHKLFFIF